MLSRFRRGARSPVPRDLYAAIVARARAPVFHTRFGVPDTIDGRFDMLTLHVFLVMDALKRRGTQDERLGTSLATLVFTGFEEALRDLGVGDIGLSHRIKALANAFYGRLEAYSAAGEGEDTLAAALRRNLYRGEDGHAADAASLAVYVMEARRRLADAALDTGSVDFGPLPE